MEKLPPRLVLLIASLFLAGGAVAQISIVTPGYDVKIGGDGSVKTRTDGSAGSGRNNEAGLTVGGISGDADVEGVTVINGRVSIDGKDVPPSVTRYKSPKTGRIYLIQRKGGAVSVSEAGGAK